MRMRTALPCLRSRCRRRSSVGLGAELVGLLVALGARGADAGPFGGVEHSALDGGGVRVESHEAAERVDFADHVALGKTADSRVAGHLAHGVGILGENERLASEAGGGESGLDSGMPGPDDDHIIRFWDKQTCSTWNKVNSKSEIRNLKTNSRISDSQPARSSARLNFSRVFSTFC